MKTQKAKDERRMARQIQKEKKGDSKAKKSKLKEWEMDYEFYIGEGLVRSGFVLQPILDLFFKIFVITGLF